MSAARAKHEKSARQWIGLKEIPIANAQSKKRRADSLARGASSKEGARQTCKVCGREDKFDFHVPDAIWSAIVPRAFRTNVVCLCCFDDFAFEKDRDFSGHLEVLYFAGRQEALVFKRAKGA
jgi:hypothetical protein